MIIYVNRKGEADFRLRARSVGPVITRCISHLVILTPTTVLPDVWIYQQPQLEGPS